MIFTKSIKGLAASIAIVLFSLTSMAVLPAAPAFAATVQEEGAIYAKNVTEGTTYSHSGTTAKAGETVSFEIYYHDLQAPDSGLNALNVRVKASLPNDFANAHTVSAAISGDNFTTINDSTSVTTNDTTQLQFIPGSVTWKHDVGTNASPQWVTQTISDSVVTDPSGVIVEQVEQPCNNFAATVAFQAKIVAQPTVTPAFSCDAFTVTADVNRSVKVSTFSNTATNGAVFKNAVVDWGDNSTPLTSSNIVGQTHQYGQDGTFLITTTAHFTVNGQDQTASGPNCQQQVTFSPNTPPKVTPPPSTPPAPTALVNTGAGSVMGIFAATTAAGAVAYRWMLGRRLSRQ